jgi:hypothetical protein
MSDDIKRIDIAEFRRLGLLQEVNRLFFHPRGLALEVVATDGEPERLGGIWDYRDDPEGMGFADNMISPTSAATVQAMFDCHLVACQELFGTLDGIQPLPDHELEGEDFNA